MARKIYNTNKAVKYTFMVEEKDNGSYVVNGSILANGEPDAMRRAFESKNWLYWNRFVKDAKRKTAQAA